MKGKLKKDLVIPAGTEISYETETHTHEMIAPRAIIEIGLTADTSGTLVYFGDDSIPPEEKAEQDKILSEYFDIDLLEGR